MLDDEPTVPEGFEGIEAAADGAIDPGEEVVTPAFYGGEGYGTVRRRNLLIMQPLADRSDLPPSIQHQMLAADIREAMAIAARRLDQEARKYSVTGYDWDLEDIQYDMPKSRVLMATLVLERE